MEIAFVPLLVMLATVKKLVDFVRCLRGGDVNSVVTQLVTWLAGWGVAWVFAQTPWAAQLDLGGVTLDHMGVWSLLVAGIAIGSAASLAHDFGARTGAPDLAPALGTPSRA